MQRLSFSIALVALVAACAPASSTDTAADEQAIRGKADGMDQALSAQNDSAIGMMFSADAVLMPPNMPRIAGRDSIRKFYAGIWPMKASLTLSPAAVHVSGDWAIDEGNYTWTMPAPAPNAPAINDHGKYLNAWHKANGEWVIMREIWNSDLPAMPMPAAAPAKPAPAGRR